MSIFREDTRVSLNGVLNVSLSGNDEETLSTVTLREICSFIGIRISIDICLDFMTIFVFTPCVEERVQRREAVLICSTFGTNRSAAVALAFLIHHNDISLRVSIRIRFQRESLAYRMLTPSIYRMRIAFCVSAFDAYDQTAAIWRTSSPSNSPCTEFGRLQQTLTCLPFNTHSHTTLICMDNFVIILTQF